MARILVVDDDALFRELARALLEAAGHEVVDADGRAAALDRFRGGGFDLVLLDLLLPGVDGASVLREMDAVGQGVPVLMLSGGGTAAEEARRRLPGEGERLAYLDKGEALDRLAETAAALLR